MQASLLEDALRQLDEVDAIAAMYDGFEAEHPVNVATLRSLCECAGGERAALELVEGEREPLAQRAALAFTVWLVDRPVNTGRPSCTSLNADGCVGARVQYPLRYPSTQPLACTVAHGTKADLSAAELDALRAAVASSAQSWEQDTEWAAEVVMALQDAVDTLVEGRRQRLDQAAHVAQEAQERAHREATARIGRRLIWFHHIKNPSKKHDIKVWSRELHLGGYSKPGFPGVVIVEGADADCEEFCRRLRRLRWQAMVVKWHESEELPDPAASVDDFRKFDLAGGVDDLGENGMSTLAAKCRGAGLEDMFNDFVLHRL